VDPNSEGGRKDTKGTRLSKQHVTTLPGIQWCGDMAPAKVHRRDPQPRLVEQSRGSKKKKGARGKESRQEGKAGIRTGIFPWSLRFCNIVDDPDQMTDQPRRNNRCGRGVANGEVQGTLAGCPKPYDFFYGAKRENRAVGGSCQNGGRGEGMTPEKASRTGDARRRESRDPRSDVKRCWGKGL